jgi:PhnB protein
VVASPASLFLYVEKVDKVVDKAVSLGATAEGSVMDMFWGDRCGTIVDPDGYRWMISTHKAEPTPKEMIANLQKTVPKSRCKRPRRRSKCWDF